jgi:hypothetical protein
MANEINEIFQRHINDDRHDADTYAEFRNTVESWRLLAEVHGYDFGEADLLKTISVLGYRLAWLQMEHGELWESVARADGDLVDDDDTAN